MDEELRAAIARFESPEMTPEEIVHENRLGRELRRAAEEHVELRRASLEAICRDQRIIK